MILKPNRIQDNSKGDFYCLLFMKKMLTMWRRKTIKFQFNSYLISPKISKQFFKRNPLLRSLKKTVFIIRRKRNWSSGLSQNLSFFKSSKNRHSRFESRLQNIWNGNKWYYMIDWNQTTLFHLELSISSFVHTTATFFYVAIAYSLS